jgi:hypothetical protein
MPWGNLYRKIKNSLNSKQAGAGHLFLNLRSGFFALSIFQPACLGAGGRVKTVSVSVLDFV